MKWADAKSPERTKEQLEIFVPREIWAELNITLVGFGQQRCKALRPECEVCTAIALCPFGWSRVNCAENAVSAEIEEVVSDIILDGNMEKGKRAARAKSNSKLKKARSKG